MQYSDEHLRYLRLLSQKYQTVAAAASEIIRIEALLRLPKGTEHFLRDQYYGEIIESIIRYDRADAYIIRFCEVIKRLAVDRLHIVGDLFDRGPRPDRILDSLMAHHQV